jgi:hypothetical protein
MEKILISYRQPSLKTQEITYRILDPVWSQFVNHSASGPSLDPAFGQTITATDCHVPRAHARSIPPPRCSLRFVKHETKTRFFPIHAMRVQKYVSSSKYRHSDLLRHCGPFEARRLIPPSLTLPLFRPQEAAIVRQSWIIANGYAFTRRASAGVMEKGSWITGVVVIAAPSSAVGPRCARSPQVGLSYQAGGWPPLGAPAEVTTDHLFFRLTLAKLRYISTRRRRAPGSTYGLHPGVLVSC